ncbi:hypothetical protein DW083_04615 [Parabacteroides sp. AF48-14]|nr:hypothetical protein DW083_04615 [Parabacteroides sp. AF48-14]
MVGRPASGILDAYPIVVSSSYKNDALPLHSVAVVSEEEIPFYIDRIIMNFHSLGKPYDVEFPLFYVDLDEHTDVSKTVSSLAEGMGEMHKDEHVCHYKVSHWDVESGMDYEGWTVASENYSVVLDPIIRKYYDMLHPEFWKLRIYQKDQRLCIACFAPYTIPEPYLEVLEQDHFLFFPQTTLLGEVWEILYGAMYFGKPQVENLDFGSEYLYHCKRTLVITLNYLLSFAAFMQVTEELETLLAKNGQKAVWQLDMQDLTYLFGPDLASRVLPLLQECLRRRDSEPRKLIQPRIIHSSLLPNLFKDAYEDQNNEDFKRCETISEMVSCNFSNLSRLVEHRSRLVYTGIDRLRYGESFTTLFNKFTMYPVKDTDRLKALHQALDKRIDEGSVVPGYVLDSSQASAPFIRMFRSGENEDRLRDQLFRTVLFLVKKVCEFSNTTKVSRQTLQYIFHLLLVNPLHFRPFSRICGITYLACFDAKSGDYSVCFRYEDGDEPCDLLDYAVRFNVLKEEDYFYSVVQNDFTSSFSTCTQLDLEGENRLVDYCRAAVFVSAHLMGYDLANWQKWYALQGSYSTSIHQLGEWADQNLDRFFTNDGECDVHELMDSFTSDFSSLPFLFPTGREELQEEYDRNHAHAEGDQFVLRILPDFTQDDEVVRLYRIVYGFYLVISLLMIHYENAEIQKEENVSWIMEELKKVTGSIGKLPEWNNPNFISETHLFLKSIFHV